MTTRRTAGHLTGEMARRIAELDWSRTPLGPAEQWPQSLRTTVSIMLHTRFPMFLFWGPEAICLYNDAYRPSLGAQMHPAALGMRGEHLWTDIWHIIGPQIQAVMTRAEQTWYSDQLVPFERSGYLEEIYFTYSYSPVFDESGGVGGTLVVCTETTERVIAQRRLWTLQAVTALQTTEVTAALAALRDVLAANDSDLAFTALYRLPAPGRAEAELVWSTGTPAGSALAPKRVPLHDDPANAPVRPWSAILTAVIGAGGRLAVPLEDLPVLPGGRWPEPGRELVVAPVRLGGSGRPQYALVTGLSPRKALDEAYVTFLDLLVAGVSTAIGRAEALEGERRRAEALAAIDRAKTAFFSNVSHEFRTPLTLVLGSVEDLLARHGGPAQAGADPEVAQLSKAHRNASRLLRLVNTLLDIARLDSEQHVAQPVATDLATLTAELAGAFASAAADAGLELVVDCPPLPRAVLVDRQMWEKVVLNLVSNAIKYTLHGRIEVRLRHDGITAELLVVDTGSGIAAGDLPYLFERFYRAGEVRARSYEGSGIGLALVAELLRLHDGTVEVTSELGRGSRFRVRLPAPEVDQRGVAAPLEDSLAVLSPEVQIFVAEAARWVDKSPGQHPDPAGKQSSQADRVLVVDDNADMRAHLSRLLGRRWQVRAAENGLRALEKIREDRPDLVLTDVMMPELDGIGLLRAIRADPELSHLPVILLSARAGQEAAVEGLDAGADDYLVKPFAATELISRVRTNLAAASAQQERTRLAEAHARAAERLVELTRTLNQAQTVADVIAAADQVAAYLDASSAQVTVGERAGAATTGSPDGEAQAVLPGPDRRPLGTLRVVWDDGSVPEGARAPLAAAADITGQALERALRFDREREIGRALQAGLLPVQLPTLDGAEVAGHYAAATADMGVGGDWYDVVRLAAGRVALVIGDVAGHGLSAAIAMGRLSQAMRAYLAEGASPADALTRLDRLVRGDPDQRFATVCCVLVDLGAGTLHWSTAGHPQPVVRSEQGPRLLTGHVGVPIGVGLSGYSYRDDVTDLAAGDVVLLYTDGLVERRTGGIQQEQLVGHVAAGPTDARGLVQHVVEGFLADDRTDDVAVLALRRSGADR